MDLDKYNVEATVCSDGLADVSCDIATLSLVGNTSNTFAVDAILNEFILEKGRCTCVSVLVWAWRLNRCLTKSYQ